MRCIICDYCAEINGNDDRTYTYSPTEHGHICSVCEESIQETINVDSYEEDGEYPNLVGPDFLEFGNVEEYLKEVGKRRKDHSSEESDIRSDDPDTPA